MGDRPRDWYPLVEEGTDPVPGDWELVQEAAARYRRTADAIERARILLREVTDSDEGWQSEAGDAFREKATDLSDDVFRAYGRYDVAANALAEYWPELEYAQEESLALRRQASATQDEIDRLERQVAEAGAGAGLVEVPPSPEFDLLAPPVDGGQDEDSDANGDLGRLRGDLELAQAELQRLRDRLAQVVEDKDVAAQRAANAIGEFIGRDGLEDGFWDDVGAAFDAFQAAMALLGEIAGQIATLAGLASLVLCWCPVLSQALAAIATIATIVSLAGNVFNGQWHDAALDLVGLATFGIGRAVGAAARGARAVAARQLVRGALPSVRGLPVAQRLAGIRELTGLRPGALTGLRQAQEGAALAQRSILGWGRHAFHNVGPDLLSGLRAPFKAWNWSVTFNPKEMLGLTDMTGVTASAANRAAVIEAAGVGGGTASGLVTHDPEQGLQVNAPISVDGKGFPVQLENPFSDVPDLYSELPGVSDSHESPWPGEAAEVGAFSYRESEAAVQ